MTNLYLAVAFFLLLNIFAGLIRVLRGPTRGDRMLAALLFGTTGVAMLLLLAEGFEIPALRNVAFVLVLLSAINAVVFVRFAGGGQDDAGAGAEES